MSVIGAGRVGSAVSARLRERGVVLDAETPDVVLLCVPDRAIAEAAASVAPGPWVGHVSGATPLAALEPHACRFSLHPLQTFVTGGGPAQLDGAWGAVCADTDGGRAVATELAETLGLRPFELADDRRALYHAGAVVAASFLVTLHRAASALLEEAGAPPAALLPLMRRTMENGFAPTGPHVRGDRATVEAHVRAVREHRPELEALYRVLAEATAAQAAA